MLANIIEFVVPVQDWFVRWEVLEIFAGALIRRCQVYILVAKPATVITYNTTIYTSYEPVLCSYNEFYNVCRHITCKF